MLKSSVIVSTFPLLLAGPGQGMWEAQTAVVLLPGLSRWACRLVFEQLHT